MISLDQVYLLEQKVESAVAKIQQLQAENDALRNKCAELTNALSAKSEQLTTIETDQNQIENGIKKALDRLNSIENTVLKTVSTMASSGQVAPTPHQTIKNNNVQTEVKNSRLTAEPPKNETTYTQPQEEIAPSFATMTQMFDDKAPAEIPNPSASIPDTQVSNNTDNSFEAENTNPLMNPFMQFDESNKLNNQFSDAMQDDIPNEDEDNQEDDLGFDIF